MIILDGCPLKEQVYVVKEAKVLRARSHEGSNNDCTQGCVDPVYIRALAEVAQMKLLKASAGTHITGAPRGRLCGRLWWLTDRPVTWQRPRNKHVPTAPSPQAIGELLE
jgi:hypothetical protein